MHRNRDARRLVDGNVNLAIGDAFGRFRRLEIPGAVAAVPLILGLDLQQFVAQAVPRQRCSVRRGEHHIEGGVLALAERSAREQRLDADHRSAWNHRQRQLALDRATSGLGHADDHLRLERTRRRRLLFEGQRKPRFAVLIGVRQVVERLADSLHVFVREPKLIAGKTRSLARERNDDLPFELELGGGRPVEIAPIDGDLRRIRLGHSLGLRSEFEFQAVGDVILDHEGRFADRRAFWIGEGAHAPGAGRSR